MLKITFKRTLYQYTSTPHDKKKEGERVTLVVVVVTAESPAYTIN